MEQRIKKEMQREGEEGKERKGQGGRGRGGGTGKMSERETER